jgi:DNA-binding transcriptional ArsR family regulator
MHVRPGPQSFAAGVRQPAAHCLAYRQSLTNPRRPVIVRCVPKYYDELDAVLRALADPTRRAIVERLAKSPAVVSELAAPFSMALPSLMQHLRVLENARLITSHKHGRVRTVSLRPGALDVLHVWLGEQRTPAERQADRLGIHLTRTTFGGDLT